MPPRIPYALRSTHYEPRIMNYALLPTLLRLHHTPAAPLPGLGLGDGRGRVHHEVLRLLVHREHRHFTDVLGARQQHHHAVDARREPAVRRRAVAEGVQHAAELLLHDLRAVARDLERLD